MVSWITNSQNSHRLPLSVSTITMIGGSAWLSWAFLMVGRLQIPQSVTALFRAQCDIRVGTSALKVKSSKITRGNSGGFNRRPAVECFEVIME
jgi:hypothetical protein